MARQEGIMSGPFTQYLQMIDIAEPEIVEICISEDGTAIWVNVDGICRLRVQRIPWQHLTLGDGRAK